MACTVRSIVASLLNDGTATSRSVNPTDISWRPSSGYRSPRRLSSGNLQTLPFWVQNFYIEHSRNRGQPRSDPAEAEPIKLIRTQSQQIRQVSNARKQISPEHLDGNVTLIGLEIELDRLRGARQIVHHQHFFFAKLPHVRQDAMIQRVQKLDRSATEHLRRVARSNHRLGPR